MKEVPNQETDFDYFVERHLRQLTQNISRRSVISTAGKLLLAATGATVVPLLPIDRRPTKEAHAAASGCYNWDWCGAYADRVCGCNVSSTSGPSGTFASGYWSSCCPDPNNGNRLRRCNYVDWCYNGAQPAGCSGSGCECWRGSPAIWCSGGGQLCCTTGGATPGWC